MQTLNKTTQYKWRWWTEHGFKQITQYITKHI